MLTNDIVVGQDYYIPRFSRVRVLERTMRDKQWSYGRRETVFLCEKLADDGSPLEELVRRHFVARDFYMPWIEWEAQNVKAREQHAEKERIIARFIEVAKNGIEFDPATVHIRYGTEIVVSVPAKDYR